MSEKIELKVSQTLKEKPDLNQLTFGEVFTDYMLSFEYSTAEGWHDLKIIPYGPIELSPPHKVSITDKLFLKD